MCFGQSKSKAKLASGHPSRTPKSSLDRSPCCYCYWRREGKSSPRPTKKQAGAHAFAALALTGSNPASAQVQPVLGRARGAATAAGAANAAVFPLSTTMTTADAAGIDRIASSSLIVMPLHHSQLTFLTKT